MPLILLFLKLILHSLGILFSVCGVLISLFVVILVIWHCNQILMKLAHLISNHLLLNNNSKIDTFHKYLLFLKSETTFRFKLLHDYDILLKFYWSSFVTSSSQDKLNSSAATLKFFSKRPCSASANRWGVVQCLSLGVVSYINLWKQKWKCFSFCHCVRLG